MCHWKQNAIALTVLFFTTTQRMEASTSTWQNGTVDLTLSTNWSPAAVPTEGYQADFTNTGNTAPTLDTTSVSNSFNIQLANFPSGAQAYTFNIADSTNFIFSGSSVNLAAVGGVLNNSSNTQAFNVSGDATLSFNDHSTALDSSSVSTATYTIGDAMSLGTLDFNNNASIGASSVNVAAKSASKINFRDQSSAAGTIDLGTVSPPTSATLNFYDNSTANDAVITIHGSSNAGSEVVFQDASHANSAVIDSAVGYIAFTGSSHADASTINTSNSLIIFAQNTNADSATINVGNSIDPSGLIVANNAGLGSSTVTAISGSEIQLSNLASAQSASIQLGALSPLSPAEISFENSSNAGSSHLYAVGHSVIVFGDSSSASYSTILLGEDINSTVGSDGSLSFQNTSDAGFSSITANGPSTITFSHTATAYQSSIELEDTSTLTFQDSSASSASQLTVTENAIVSFSQTGDDTFSGGLTGNGTVRKNGTGILTIATDNSGFAGTTSITNGKLALALNSMLGGNVSVSNEGILSGIGTIVGSLNVNNRGTIAPGNSIGTLFVNGTYTQSNSTYQVQVNDQGLASLIDVIGGTATLGDGAGVTVIPLFTQLSAGQVFTVPILHADGGLTGTFSTLMTTNPLVAVRLGYDPNNAYLTYQNALALNAFTFNEQQVANQLVSITSPTAEESAVLNELVGLAPNNQAAALNQMSAQQYATLLITAEDTNRRFIRRLYDPLRSIITAAPCARKPRCCPRDTTTWLTGSWEGSSYKGNCNAQGFKSNGFEVSLGAQTHCEDWTFGIAGAYEWDHYHYNVGGTGNSNTGLGALYALYRPSCYYALADLVIGGSDQKVTRPIDIGSFHYTKHGRPSMFQGAIYTEAGFDCYWDSLLVQPFLGFEFGYYNRDRIHEHSDDTFLDVYVHQTSRGTVNSRLGLHLSNQWTSCWTLAVDLAWQYRLTPLANKIEENFSTFGDDFQIKGVPVPRSSFDTVVNLSFAPDDSWRVYAEAAGQCWMNNSFYSVLGGIEFSW